MDLIQFRIHPSVGMARFGESTEWYFLGPEFPRFMQEQFPNLRFKPLAQRHPSKAPGTPEPAKPADGVFRDAAHHVMPQAARFRIFAYVFNVGSREPYKVVEVTASDADIEWTVEVANRKTVRSSNDKVDVNKPDPVKMTTDPASGPSQCKRAGDVPNLAWLALESGTGRLHVIGNEGIDRDLRPTPPKAAPRLFQYDWFDTAADGPVSAIVKPKAAFLSRFAGFRYFIPGQKDPQGLPSSGAVDAVSAWVVINMPDYVPDFGHFISLWDLTLAQAWKQVADGKVSAVDGRHFLAATPSGINDYAFYDYETHIHPVLTVFNDVNSTSGQTRNATGEDLDNHALGIVIKERLTEDADDTQSFIKVKPLAAFKLRAAAFDSSLPAPGFAPFNVVVSMDDEKPFHSTHEIMRCTGIADDGTLTVTRGTSGTTASAWSSARTLQAAPPGTFLLAKMTADVASATQTLLEVEPVSAHKMRQPIASPGDLNNGAFLIALTNGTLVEWVKCTKNDKRNGKLTVERGQLSTTAATWSKTSAIVVTGGGGHKTYDARGRMTQLARGARGAAHKRIYERLRLPVNVYQRKFKTLDGADVTPFPRQYGRRWNVTGADGIDTVTGDPAHSRTMIPGSVNIDPAGSLSPQWLTPALRAKKGKACKGEDHGTGDDRIRDLDDLYWIATERDMPMLKEYAVTQLQFDQFEYWATGSVTTTKGSKLRWAPLFTVLFEGTPIGTFLKTPGHTAEQCLQEFAKRLPRYTPAMLDMANLGKMLGGSFLPGIEVGREGGKADNWSLVHGATKYFPDIRFRPPTGSTPHAPGMLTKDLAIPWFNDFVSCDETYWPTSRPQVVYQEHGFAYQWLDDPDDVLQYWRKVGFIRRSGNTLVEQERTLERP